MANRQLVQSLLDTVQDYGDDDQLFKLRKLSIGSIEAWIHQFPIGFHDNILSELNHVFQKTYFSRDKIWAYLSAIIQPDKLAKHCDDYWSKVTLLNSQGGGSSQRKLNQLLHEVAKGVGIEISSNPDGRHYIYLDDCLYSGFRIKTDLENWIANQAPREAVLDISLIAYHRLGQWQVSNAIKDAKKAAGKEIDVTWWRGLEFENRKSDNYLPHIDTLRPRTLPNDASVLAYCQGQGQGNLYLRPTASVGEHKLYSSPQARELLEEQLLIQGVRVKAMCPNFREVHRPLGFWGYKGLGFGSLFVTYLNCPNSAPLALWASAPWTPLFQRRNN